VAPVCNPGVAEDAGGRVGGADAVEGGDGFLGAVGDDDWA